MSRQSGFSLTETLMAVGTLAVGLLFIAGTFMTGIFFATISTERTIAGVAADEAFAKIQLYGVDWTDPNLASPDPNAPRFVPYKPDVFMGWQEHLYPSTVDASLSQYSWAALCKRVSATSQRVAVTVFVSRQAGTVQPVDANQPFEKSSLPRPVRVEVKQSSAGLGADELEIVDPAPMDGVDENTFIDDGSTVVCDETGRIYRVLERYADRPNVIKLDRPWSEPDPAGVLVIPPPVSGGRNPFVAVYQRVLRLEAE